MEDQSNVITMPQLIPSQTKILDKGEQKHYWEEMLLLCNAPKWLTHFPGINPQSIQRAELDVLRRECCMVSLKTDGVRYFMMFTTKRGTLEPICVLIDRARVMYEIEVWASEHYFIKKSLFDAELVWTHSMSLALILFDAYIVKGVACHGMTYIERMALIRNSVLNVSQQHEDDVLERMITEEDKFIARNNMKNLHIAPKTCVDLSRLSEMWRDRAQCHHRNDGLIFTTMSPARKPIFKWKPTHTIDLLTLPNGTVMANDNTSVKQVRCDEIGGRAVFVKSNALLRMLATRLPRVIEYSLTLEENQIVLHAHRERCDKLTANTVATIHATVQNVFENINVEELFALSAVA